MYFEIIVIQQTILHLNSLFNRENELQNEKLKDAKIKYAKNSEGITMKCGETECVFEILVYRYRGIEKCEQPKLVPPKHSTSKAAGSLALIVPSHMFTVEQQDDFQRFLNGEGAIKLHARSFTNPIEFIFPQCE